jgi:hypothetical protein
LPFFIVAAQRTRSNNSWPITTGLGRLRQLDLAEQKQVNKARHNQMPMKNLKKKVVMQRLRICILVGLAFLLSLGHSANSHSDKDENIAFGKGYKLYPTPNYSLCTDAGDLRQLTDGTYAQGRIWSQKSTVGWKAARFVEITIDLNTDQPISGLSLNTAAGTASVTWPKHIFVMVSTDARIFSYGGDLVSLSSKHGIPPVEGYHVYRYWTHELATHGRFVRIVIYPDGPFTFADEIEIFRGDVSFLAKPLAGNEITDTAAFINEMELTPQVQRRLRADLDAVRQSAVRLPNREDLLKKLSEIEKQIPDVQILPTAEFRTVFPIHELHKRIFAVQAAAWRATLPGSILIWQKSRWDMVSPTEQPAPTPVDLDVAMMINEFRSTAFNVSNSDSMPVALKLSITGFPGGTNPHFISVYDVPFTDTKSGMPVMAALLKAAWDGQDFLIRIEPGMTRQVWLTFHSQNLTAGEYNGAITINPVQKQIPLRLRVFPFTFPVQPTLHLAGWDYTDREQKYDVTKSNRALLIQHLQEHYVDCPWATSSVMPNGEYDRTGQLIVPPASVKFRKWIDLWPSARNYCIYLAVGPKFAGFAAGTAEFSHALKSWITWWIEQLALWHIRPEQLQLLLVDEPNTKDEDELIIDYGLVIKEAQPKVVIWEDVLWREPWRAQPNLFRVCDVLCPQMNVWIDQGKPFADFYAKQRQMGKELWFYSCSGASRLLDPYAYYLLQEWFCWKYQAQGSAFWAFGDSNGASSWNEYIARIGASTPLFLDAESVTAGKHMEAIREGVQDYEYLVMLRDRIAELDKRHVQNGALVAAKQLLKEGVDRVTGIMTSSKLVRWSEAKDRTVADQVRLQVLEALSALHDL